MLPSIAWCAFADMLGPFYRVAVWLLPMWWMVRLVDSLESRLGAFLTGGAVPDWLMWLVIGVGSMLLGAAVGLGVWRFAHWIRSAGDSRQGA
jgi:hypothetical protein